MLTLIATVLETGFTSVSTLAAEITTEDGIVVNNDALEEADQSNDGDLQIEVSSDGEEDAEVSEDTDEGTLELSGASDDSSFEVGSDAAEEESFEEAEELKEGQLDVSDSGISGSGYDEISIFVNTDDLARKDKFRLSFSGPVDTKYNSAINEELDRTGGGYYDFDNLEGSYFSLRASASSNVDISYGYNADGYPQITVASRPVEKSIDTRTVTVDNGETATAIVGAGYDSFKIDFDTKELSKGVTFKLIVDTNADAKVDSSVFDKDADSVTIEDLEGEEFTAYVVCEDRGKVDRGIESDVEYGSVDDDAAKIIVKDYTDGTYRYEDDKVLVTATVQKKGALPANAYFGVEPLSQEDGEKYLATLNENAEEGVEYTAENTLLYDIGFYTDDTKEEEIEPEEGSVTFNIQFKRDQLAEDLGAQEAEDIEVNHFVEEGSRIVVDERMEADVANDVGSVEITTDSFSVFALSAINDGVKVTINGQDGTYYAVVARENEGRFSYLGKATRIDVTGGTGSQKVKPWDWINKEGNAQIVLLAPDYKEKINVGNGQEVECDIDRTFTKFTDGDYYNYANKITYADFDTNNKEQVINVAPAASGTTKAAIKERLQNAANYAVVADDFTQIMHYEGNIAVNNAHFTGDAIGVNGTEKKVNLTITITKNVVTAREDTFHFGIYDSNDQQVATLDITTNSNGYGTGSYTINDAKSSYEVFELDDSGNKILNNGKYKDYTVTYGTSSGLDNVVGNYGVSSFAKNVIGRKNLTFNSNNTVLYTTTSGVTCDKGKVIKVTSAEFDQLVDISGMFADMNALSRALYGLGSSNEVVVYNITRSNFPDTDYAGHIYFPAVGSDQYLVFNIIIPKGQTSFDLKETADKIGLNNFDLGSETLKLGGQYETSDQADLASRTIWNFVYDDGTPYTGTVTQSFDIGGTLLAPSGTINGGKSAPAALYAYKVVQAGGEIHKGGFTFDISNNAEISVTNTAGQESGSLKIIKRFKGTAGFNAPTAESDKAKVKFTVTGPNNFRRVLTLNDFTSVQHQFPSFEYVFPSVPLGEYTCVEENEYTQDGYSCTTTYSVRTDSTTAIVDDAAVAQVKNGATAEMYIINEYKQGLGVLALCKSFPNNNAKMPITDFYFKIVKYDPVTKTRGEQVTGFKMVDRATGQKTDPVNDMIHIHLDPNKMFGGDNAYGGYYTETVFAVDIPIGTYDIIECYEDGEEVPQSAFGWRNRLFRYKKLETGGMANYPDTDEKRRGLWDKYANIAHSQWGSEDSGVVFNESDIVWDIWFENEFDAEGNIPLKFIKTINGERYTGNNPQFSFEISTAAGDTASFDKLPDSTTANSINGEITFNLKKFLWSDLDTKDYWENGREYTFFVKEKEPVATGYSIDKSEYKVVVKVTRPDDKSHLRTRKLNISAKYYKIKDSNGVALATEEYVGETTNIGEINNQGAPAVLEGAVFNNRYGAIGSVHVYARKIYNRPLNGQDFTFELTKANNEKWRDSNGNETNNNPIVAKNAASTQKDEDGLYRGWIDFGEIYYTSDDLNKDNKLIVRETSSGNSSISYGAGPYTINLTLNDNQQGVIVVTADNYVIEHDPRNNLNFENTYLAKNSIEFKVAKEYTSEIPADEELKLNVFNFTLQEIKVNDVGYEGPSYNLSLTGENAGTKIGPTYQFEMIKNGIVTPDKAVGTHFYKIDEITNTAHGGVIFDENYYIVEVKIEDDGVKETLKRTVTVHKYDKDGNEIASEKQELGDVPTITVKFSNGYDFEPTSVPVRGEKELITTSVGRNLTAGEFKFKLEAYGETVNKTTPAQGETVAPVVLPTADANGDIIVSNGNTNEGANVFVFDDITFNKAGTYQFKISEVNEGKTGIIYSDDYYIATIKIKDIGGQLAQDGLTTYQLVRKNNDTSVANNIKFKNYEGETSTHIDVKKKINAIFDKAPEPGDFEFELYKVEGQTQTKLEPSQYNDANGDASFTAEVYDELNYDVTDFWTEAEIAAVTDEHPTLTTTRNYVVKEKEGSNGAYTYDGLEKPVTVLITYTKVGDSYTLTAEPQENNGVVEVINTFNEKGHVDLGGFKKMLGRKFTAEDNGLFEAVLTPKADNPTGAYLDEACTQADAVQTADIEYVSDITKIWEKIKDLFGVGNSANAQDYAAEFKFGTIYFNKPGTYYYTMTERAKTEGVPENVTVSNMSVNVKVVVEDTNTSEFDVKYYYNNVLNGTALFVNEAKADGDVILHANKELWLGKKDTPAGNIKIDPAAGEFTYILEPQTAGDKAKKQTKTNNADGTVDFDKIEYTQDMLDDVQKVNGVKTKVFTYKITEKGPSTSYTTYDESVFYADVTVSDTGATKLDTTTVPVKYYTLNGTTKNYTPNAGTDYAVFKNYRYAEGSIQIPVTKLLTGRVGLTTDTFTFGLYKADGITPVKDKDDKNITATVTGGSLISDPEAIAFFPELKYTILNEKLRGAETATEIYRIKEIVPENPIPGIEYSAADYKITVTLKDEKNGSIKVTYKAENISTKAEDDRTVLEKLKDYFSDKPLIRFTNKYSANGKLQLVVEKKVSGVSAEKLPANGQFSFNLKGSYEGKSVDTTLKNDGNGLVYFAPMEFTKATGANESYTFTVQEKVENKLTGFTYDEKEYKIYVKVEDNNEGKLVVKTSTDNSTFTVPSEAVINVTKEGASEVTTTPDPDGKTAYVPGRITIWNNYIPNVTNITLEGNKEFTGNYTKDYLFKFTLTGPKVANGSEVKYAKNSEHIAFSKIDFTADDLLAAGIAATADEKDKVYVKSRSFDYTVVEEKAEVTNEFDGDYTGVVFDPFETRKITVEVKDVNGQLVASISGNEKIDTETNTTVNLLKDDPTKGNPATAFVFQNTYGDGELVIPVEKVVKGTSADNYKDKEFEFEIFEGQTGNKKACDNIKVKAGERGSFTIKYNLSQLTEVNGEYTGNFYYRVREVNKTNYPTYVEYNGYKYDTSEHDISVKVKAVKNASTGKYEFTYDQSASVAKDGNLSSTLQVPGGGYTCIFVNEYMAKTNIQLEGLKVLENRPIRKGEKFTFTLSDENGKSLTAESDDNGVFVFGSDEYKEGELLSYSIKDLYDETTKVYKPSDTFKYTVVEELPNGVNKLTRMNNGITYSAAEYEVTVTVKDNGDGTLTAVPEIKQTKGDFEGVKVEQKSWIDKFIERFTGKQQSELKFTNVYSACGWTDPPIINKKIMGEQITARDQFEFELRDVSGAKILIPGQNGEDPVRVLDGTGNYIWTSRFESRKSYNDELGRIEFGEVFYTLDDFKGRTPEKDAAGNDVYTFVYNVKEIQTNDRAMNGVTPAEFELTVKLYDDGYGTIVRADQKLEQKTANAFTEEAWSGGFVNTFNAEGSFNLDFVKNIVGRDITPEDKGKFAFVITELEHPATLTNRPKYEATVYNTDGTRVDAKGRIIPDAIKFSPDDPNLAFLNYKFGTYPDPKDSTKAIWVDETGTYRYQIVEKDGNMPAGVRVDKTVFEVQVKVEVAKDKKTGERLKDANGNYYLTTDTRIFKKSPIPNTNRYETKEVTGLNNELQFDNPFDAKAKIDIPGKKILQDADKSIITGKELLETKFNFAIYSYDDGNRDVGKQLVDDEDCDINGDFTLDIPEYTMDNTLKNPDGSYATERDLYYRIVETKLSSGKWKDDTQTVWMVGPIEFDNTEYDLDVHVEYVPGSDELKVTKVFKDAATGQVLNVGTKQDPVKFVNTKEEWAEKHGTKYWIDKGDPKDHPIVTIDLYSSAVNNGQTDINTYEIKPGETTYLFTTDRNNNKLPKYDKDGKEIKYTVKERDLLGYISEQVGDDFYNSKGDVLIRKIDADTGATLAGAVLAILDGSTEIERWTSGVSAHVVEKQLTAGKTYTLHEISAPEGYELAPDQTFTVPSDGSMITVTMSDRPIIGSVRLTKADAATRERLAGAQFALYSEGGARIYASGTPGSYRVSSTTSNDIFEVDASGYLEISNLPYGTYYFRETKAPDGYAFSRERLGFTILRSGELVEVTFLDPKATGAVRLRKVGAGSTRGLGGAVFELYSSKPRTAGQAAASTIFSDAYFRYDTYRTNADGEIYVDDLPWDDYYFIEVSAPAGYSIATDVNGDPLVYTFTVDEATAGLTYDLGSIVNYPEEEVPPPPTTTITPTTTPVSGVLGERVERVQKGGVVNGVLGVRAKPTSGVLGERVGPVTGDASNIILWLLLLSACVATIVATIVTGKKKKTGAK